MQSERISVYPNPVSRQLTISVNAESTMQSIDIYDITGAVIVKINAENKSEICLPINQYLDYSGIFMLRITTTKGVVNRRFVFKQ